MWMDPEDITLSEINETEKGKYCMISFTCAIRMYIHIHAHISNCQHPLNHRKSIQKNIYFCFIDYAEDFDCVDHNKLWKILQEMRIPDHVTCLLRNLYAGQEERVRTRSGTIDWFQIGKRVHQGYILSLCLFNLCKIHHAKCKNLG